MGCGWSVVAVLAGIGLSVLVPIRARADTVTARTHVRATTEEVRRIIETGLSASATFRRLVAVLDDSDVMVYVEPKLKHKGLGGYLSHTIVASGSYRYLRVFIDIGGRPHARVPVLAHELQHAVEVSRVGVVRLFCSLAVPHGWGESRCYDTQEGTDTERLVRIEMSPRGRASVVLLTRR